MSRRLLTLALFGLSFVLTGCDDGPGAVDSDAPKEFTTTDSGLRYRILRKADGPKPNKTDSVKVHYKGWLDNGKVFDSSYDRGQWATFRLDQVILAWTEGLQLCSVGGMIELEVPSQLGYGPQGTPGIHPKPHQHDLSSYNPDLAPQGGFRRGPAKPL